MSSANENSQTKFLDDEKRWGYILSPYLDFYEKSDGLELMAMHLTYHEEIENPEYVTSGSILACTLGDKYVKVDLTEDYGAVTKIGTPLLTCSDCHESNIHNFGSCLCMESSYGLIPKTPAYRVDKDGNQTMAKKREGNESAHICVPLLMEAWQQVNRQTLVAINAQILAASVLRENVQYTYSPALLDDAYLVCRLGGIIKIVQVNTEPEKPDDLYIVIKDGGIRLRDDDEISDTIKTLNKNRVLRINNKASKEFEGNTYVSVYYDDSKIGWVAEKFISKVDSDTEKYTVLYTDLTDDEVHVVGTLIGETLTLSDRESKACAHTVINRTKYPQWSAQSLYDICNVREYNGAGNEVYEDFKKYYDEGRNMAYEGKMGEAWKYEQKINAILPVIRGQEADFTDNAVYFSTRPMSYHGKQVLIGENFTHMFYQYK